MRTGYSSFLTALACLLFSAGACAARAPITDVLLFPGGATITRTVQVSPGMTEAVIAGLPSGFDMQTLRADGSPGIHIGEIVSADAAKTEAVNPAEASLEARISALLDQQAALDAEAKSAQMVVDYLTHVSSSEGAPGRDQHAPPLDARTLSGVANAMGTEAGRALAKIQRIAVQKREIGKRAEALQRDLARLRTGTRDTRTLTVNFTAQRAGTLAVSYQVSNAGWRPAYRASLNSETSRLELERKAIISQKTGEDWSNVHLTLLTSQPQEAAGGREPQPWLVSWQAQMAGMAVGALMADKREAAQLRKNAPAPAKPLAEAAATADEAEPEEEPYAPPTFETRNMFATRFDVPARTSLPADGREVAVALNKQDIAVKQYLQTAPRQDPAVYVTAEADTPEGDWPAGNMQLFRDGSYIGNSEWNPQAKERLVLAFGRDDQINVAVIPLKTDTASSGVIAKRRQKKIATAFTIANHHPRPVSVLVVEPSPVATSDEVKVRTAFDPKPTSATWEDKRGVVAWEMKLAPKQTARIKTEYEIDYPNEGNLIEQRY